MQQFCQILVNNAMSYSLLKWQFTPNCKTERYVVGCSLYLVPFTLINYRSNQLRVLATAIVLSSTAMSFLAHNL
jgi:hypothetical protein